MRAFLADFVAVFEACLGRAHAHSDLVPAIAKGEGTADDVGMFLLRDFAEKLRAAP